VITIIAILAAMLFPTLSRARKSAKTISCLSNSKQIGMFFMFYMQDADSFSLHTAGLAPALAVVHGTLIF